MTPEMKQLANEVKQLLSEEDRQYSEYVKVYDRNQWGSGRTAATTEEENQAYLRLVRCHDDRVDKYRSLLRLMHEYVGFDESQARRMVVK